MANLKNITELPVAESAEGLNLIVNDNGAAKQIAASAVGAQADFAVTDESSPAFIKNKPEIVQADWAETDESSMAFIKNKPVEEYDLSIKLRPVGFTDGNINIECELLSGSYNAVAEKLNNGIAPKVCVFEDGSNMGELTDGEVAPWISVIETSCALYSGDESYVNGWGFNFQWRILPDNTIETQW